MAINFFIFSVLITLSYETENRNKGCGMLILVDDTMMAEINYDEKILREKVNHYISELNTIFKDTILKDPPNNDIYFYIKHVTHLKNFLPDCNNGGVCLFEISVTFLSLHVVFSLGHPKLCSVWFRILLGSPSYAPKHRMHGGPGLCGGTVQELR